MFEWFFNMPDWLYLTLGAIAVIAFLGFKCRNEIREWWESAKNPELNFWEMARQAEEDMRKPSGLGWPESK